MIIASFVFKIGTALERPAISERVEDHAGRLPGSSDNGFARVAVGFDTSVEAAQAGGPVVAYK